ncbi:MAG TPA: trypsin-like peptidase domain-containing protein [Blastocatellia bacterium]|nr:trypsin-like peptidase domain-containing protein [Blastocatellia bacterium]
MGARTESTKTGLKVQVVIAGGFCLLSLILLSIILLSLIPAFGRPSQNHSTARADARQRVKEAISAVGVILVRNPHRESGQELWPRGSGVLVRKDGVVATCLHVIEQDNSDVFYDELFFALPGEGGGSWTTMNRYRLSVALTSGKYDLALLRVVPGDDRSPVPSNFPAIDVTGAASVQVLDELTIIGYPEMGGATVTVNAGIVEGTDSDGGWIKTDGRLIHGNSGGAAVNDEGKLIGIPTKVVLDEDKGHPYGAVGFLRPAHLVAAMLTELGESERIDLSARKEPRVPAPPLQADTARVGASPPLARLPQQSRPSAHLVTVRGIVRSATDGKPIAGVRVGLIVAGSQDVTETTLLCWGGTNGEGHFEMNTRVPVGRYTLKARAIGYEVYTREVEIGPDSTPLLIGLEPSS